MWSVDAPIFVLYKAISCCSLYFRGRDKSIGKVSMYSILFNDLESGRSGNRCAPPVVEPYCLIPLQYSALGHFKKAKGLASFMARAAFISPLDCFVLLPLCRSSSMWDLFDCLPTHPSFFDSFRPSHGPCNFDATCGFLHMTTHLPSNSW